MVADEGQYSAAVFRDISAIKDQENALKAALQQRGKANRELEASKSILFDALDAVSEPIAIWDKNHRLVHCNNAFGPRILGSDRVPEPGTTLDSVLDEASVSGQFSDAIGNESEWAQNSIEAIKRGPIDDITHFTDGRIHHAVSHALGNGDIFIISSDITEIERQRIQLETYSRELEQAHEISHHQAYHDELTGLGNRRFLSEALEELLARRKQRNGHIAALHIDLDRFKQINDTRGHALGDAVLVHVSAALRKAVRKGDILAKQCCIYIFSCFS